MNGPLALDCARKALARPEIAGEKEFFRRIELLHKLLYSRNASDDDRRFADEFFGPDPVSRESKDLWERYVHGLLLTNEFAFVD
jgi:hypothetical protein